MQILTIQADNADFIEKAKEILIRGFSEEITKALPLEYAMEMNNLIKLEMQNM